MNQQEAIEYEKTESLLTFKYKTIREYGAQFSEIGNETVPLGWKKKFFVQILDYVANPNILKKNNAVVYDIVTTLIPTLRDNEDMFKNPDCGKICKCEKGQKVIQCLISELKNESYSI